MDSDDIRIHKIFGLIKQSKFGIHDLSRAEISEDNPTPRFNMPLELGIFIGCKSFGESFHREKKYLIFDKESYRYQKFISDISGQDIRNHKNKPEEIIQLIRDWLSNNSRATIPGQRFHLNRYRSFKKELKERCSFYDWDYDKLTFKEYCRIIEEFIQDQTITILDKELGS